MHLIKVWLSVKILFTVNAILKKLWDVTRNLGTHLEWLSNLTISKFCHSSFMEKFALYVNYYFRYFMSISHGVNRKTPPSACRHLPPPIRFSPGCLLFYKKHFINFFKKHFINLIPFSSHLIRLSAKDKTFSKEKNFFFNWLLVGFDFAVLFMCFLRCFFIVLS